MVLGHFGAAREKCPERYIICPGLGCNQGSVPTIAAGHPDDAVGPEEASSLGIGHVVFADMHPVAIELRREIRPVVHDEGDAALLRDRLKHASRTPDFIVRDVLQPKLEASDIATAERFLEVPRKTIEIERGRRDQVKPGRRPRVVAGANLQSFP